MTYEDLDVFKLAHRLVLDIYRLTKGFPADERFRLVDQLCRAASSIPANIAEGYGRFSLKERVQFLYIARGSIEEAKYHLLLARDLGFIQASGPQDTGAPGNHDSSYQALRDRLDSAGRMLNRLIESVKNRGTKKPSTKTTRIPSNQDTKKPRNQCS